MLSWECEKAGLDPRIPPALEAAAAAYGSATGETLRVTSGLRTLRRQAELMAAMTDAQLRALYARNGTPDYVQNLEEARRRRGTLDAETAYGILKSRKEGYISAHLSGAAADLATDGVSNLPLLRKFLDAGGFDTLDERDDGIPCLHCRFRAAAVRIVAE